MTAKQNTKKGFFSLGLITFFGAANDNILKQILTLMVVAGGLWANCLGSGSQGIISLVLTVPFIFLSGYAGQIADKYSRQQVIFWVKFAEIPIALFALGGLFLGNFWLSLTALLLLAVQSSFYGPAKFGIIPDIVPQHKLSQANGLINAIANVAVILGSLVAGPLADLYHPIQSDQSPEEKVQVADASSTSVSIQSNTDQTKQPQRLPVGLVMVGVAIAGLFAVNRLPRTPAAIPDLKLKFDFLATHIQTLKRCDRPLMVVMLSWSSFYLIGTLALLLIPEYRSVLDVSNTAITTLIGLLAISITIGSCVVGFISGSNIRPNFAVAGAVGMTVCFLILGTVSVNYLGLSILMSLIGISAGFYIVPLQSLLQLLSPENERGRFFGTANALSFLFISGAGLIYFLLSNAGVPPQRIPLVCGLFAAIGTVVGWHELVRIRKSQQAKLLKLKDHTDSEES